MHMLDVGGGFEDESFETMACSLREAIAREFPGPIAVIAEPGRFYASGFYTMIYKVIAHRTHTGRGEFKIPEMLYLNDGVYGCFSLTLTENAIYTPKSIELQDEYNFIPRKLEPHRYTIWGPSCCGFDCISKEVVMDQEIVIGDWLKFGNMGGKRFCQPLDVWILASLGEAIELLLTVHVLLAYTSSISSQFNGFSNNYKIIYAK
jgi:ornithine decarboxylase